jgi:hypothetical protein
MHLVYAVIAGVLIVVVGVAGGLVFLKVTGRENGIERADRLRTACRARDGIWAGHVELCFSRQSVIDINQ